IRLVGLSLRSRWRRSLQLRVATYTTVASALLVVVFGVLVASRTTSGLVNARVVAAERQLANGQHYAQPYLNALSENDESTQSTMYTIVTNLGAQSGAAAGSVPAILFPPLHSTDVTPVFTNGYTVAGDSHGRFADLKQAIGSTRIAHQFVECDPTTD